MRFCVFAFIVTAVLPLTAAEAPLTFNRDIAPILYRHCSGCHHAGDIAPMPLLTYRDAKPWAAAIREAVLTRKMPPWKADPHYGKWSNDWSLPERDIATIKQWVDGGKLEGNPGDLPPAPVYSSDWKIGTPDQVFAIPDRVVAPTGPDEYVYIKVPTNFTEDRWVTAAELRPGNRKVVHHAHVFVQHEGAGKSAGGAKEIAAEYAKSLQVHEGSLSWVKPDAPVINDGCTIDDNGAFPGSKPGETNSLLSSYLPGREPDVFPEGTARLIPAGATLNFQIHYSRSGKPEPDATAVGLIFAKEPPRQVAHRIDISNHLFRIPAGSSNQEVTECHTFTKAIYVTSLTPHMHYRGKSMQIVATYPDGRDETLLSVPAYNFNWQITYRAEKPIYFPAGTRVAIIAHFDNSANNPLNPDPAKVIRWGAASETEMMDGWIEYTDALVPVTTAARGR